MVNTFVCAKFKKNLFFKYINQNINIMKTLNLIINELIFKLSNGGYQSEFEKTKNTLESNMPKKDLLEENSNIGDLKKYLMEINNLKFNFKNK